MHCRTLSSHLPGQAPGQPLQWCQRRMTRDYFGNDHGKELRTKTGQGIRTQATGEIRLRQLIKQLHPSWGQHAVYGKHHCNTLR